MTDITAIKARAEAAADDCWQDLLDKDDRTSPAEYPNMCLIDRDELGDYIATAVAPLFAEVERLTKERDTLIAASKNDNWAAKQILDEAIKDRDNSLTIANANHAQWERAESRVAQLEAKLAEARAENDKLRAALGNDAGPCVYCGLAKEDWAKCADGFPGCGRADDAMLCPHVGESMVADEALAEARAENERLRATMRKAAYVLGKDSLTNDERISDALTLLQRSQNNG